MADNDKNVLKGASVNFPSLTNLLGPNALDHIKATVNQIKDYPERAKNQYMTTMHDQNKNLFGVGGLEEITPETPAEQAQQIMEQRRQMETMASLPENMAPAIGGIAKAAPSAAEAILASRAAGKSVSVIPEAVKTGRVVVPEANQTAAQAYAKIKNLMGK